MPQSARSSLSLSLSILSDIYEILCGISDEQLNVAYRAGKEIPGEQGCRSTFSILLVIVIKLHSHIMYDEYIRF